jgi:RNA polymerase sigma factor (sigma-70 family)
MDSNLDLVVLYRETIQGLSCYIRGKIKNKSETDDYCQEVYLRYYKAGYQKNINESRAILYSIARNLILDKARSSQREAREALSRGAPAELELSAIIDVEPNAERITASKQELAAILIGIERLPERCRAAFLSVRFEGLTYDQTAQRMNISRSMVEKHVIEALKKLNLMLAELR